MRCRGGLGVENAGKNEKNARKHGKIWGEYGENMGEWGKDAGNNVVEDEEHDEDMVEEKTIMVERCWKICVVTFGWGWGVVFFWEEKRILTMGEIPIRRPFPPKSCLVKIGVMNLDHGRVYQWPFLWEVDDASWGEERGHRERLVNIQGEFLNPVVAHRMRAKNNPYRSGLRL